MQIKNKRVLKNGMIGGYVKQKDGSWRFRFISGGKKSGAKKSCAKKKKVVIKQKGGIYWTNSSGMVDRDKAYIIISDFQIDDDDHHFYDKYDLGFLLYRKEDGVFVVGRHLASGDDELEIEDLVDFHNTANKLTINELIGMLDKDKSNKNKLDNYLKEIPYS